MQLGLIGLGRTDSSKARRLLRKGHECVVYAVEQALGDASDIIVDGGTSHCL